MTSKLMRFENLDSLRTIEDFVRNFQLKSFVDDVLSADMSLKADVKESDDSFTIKANLPGVKKQDIKIEVRGDQVFIDAEVKKEHEEKQGEYLRAERHVGRQSRVFSLGYELDESEAKASYKDGVLSLVIPKKKGAATKKIEID